MSPDKKRESRYAVHHLTKHRARQSRMTASWANTSSAHIFCVGRSSLRPIGRRQNSLGEPAAEKVRSPNIRTDRMDVQYLGQKERERHASQRHDDKLQLGRLGGEERETPGRQVVEPR